MLEYWFDVGGKSGQAAGTDHVRHFANPQLPPRLRVSKGIHILLPPHVINSTTALLIPKTEDERVIFAIPWRGWLLVGATEDDAHPGDEMIVTEAGINYLLEYLRRYLAIEVTAADVGGGFAGLRPLMVASSASKSTEKLIRDHEVEVDCASGLISVLGGKWTTYQAMAEDGVNHVQEGLGIAVGGCRTQDHPLSGSDGFTVTCWQRLMKEHYLSGGVAQHLAEKYGTNPPKLLELIEEDPDLPKPAAFGATPIRAEIVYGARREMATSIADILGRRIGSEFYGWSNAIEAGASGGAVFTSPTWLERRASARGDFQLHRKRGTSDELCRRNRQSGYILRIFFVAIRN